tara:strand:+ start:10290 stop:11546 length:1257 start_codon:yes stop_codon:yes gene_type:complete
MKVIVRGPALTRTGYGEHTRTILRAMRENVELDIYLMPVNWGQSGWVWEDSDERVWMDHLIKKTAVYQQQGNPVYDMSIQVTIPNEWERMAPINIGVTAGIETTKVAAVWLEKANMMDHVVTISNHSKEVYENTAYHGTHKETGAPVSIKCETAIDIVPYPVKKHAPVELGLELETDFNFLSVAQWGPRKNVENQLTWFVEEFIDNPEVGFVLKTFGKNGSNIDRVRARNTIQKVLAKYPQRQCKVYLLHGDMLEEEIHSLYTHPKIKALVSLSHGEGFGLPHFEAAYSGLPVIAPEWSGYLDFLCMPKKDKKGREKVRPFFATVEYDISQVNQAAVWAGVIEADSAWCYAQAGSYKMRLREVYKDHGRFVKQAKTLQKWVSKNFTKKIVYDKFNAILGKYTVQNEWQSDLDAVETVG